STSLAHLSGTPRLYGWTWDAKVRGVVSPTRCDRGTSGVDGVRGVGDIAAVCYSPSEIDGRDTVLWSFTPIRGSIGPAIVAGRAAGGTDEVVLGRDTLDALHKHVGDRVRIDGGRGARTFRVVGRAVFPPLVAADAQHLADGAVLAPSGYAAMHVP